MLVKGAPDNYLCIFAILLAPVISSQGIPRPSGDNLTWTDTWNLSPQYVKLMITSTAYNIYLNQTLGYHEETHV